MRIPQQLRPFWDPLVQLILLLRSYLFAWQLELQNCFAHTSAVSPGGPVVSLTSYGKRVETVHLTLESIARGSLRPSRLILWLDDPSIFHNPPVQLERLKHRGVEVHLTTNWGPHTKYYPYVESQSQFDLPLVTADDDILYPTYWLSRLAKACSQSPELIHCYRARLVAMDGHKLARYEHWRLSLSKQASFRNFATGVSGVIYPPKMLRAIQQSGPGFMECCPKADDLWLHVQALRAGFKIRQIVPKARHFLLVPGTQRLALQNSNRGGAESGNDRQASITYTESDLQMLNAAEFDS